MNRPGDEFLAGSTITEYQHGCLELCSLGGDPEHGLHGFAFGHQAAEVNVAFNLFDPLFELAVFLPEVFTFLGLFQRQIHLVGFKGFGDIIIGTQLHRLNSGVNGSVSRHHNYGCGHDFIACGF